MAPDVRTKAAIKALWKGRWEAAGLLADEIGPASNKAEMKLIDQLMKIHIRCEDELKIAQLTPSRQANLVQWAQCSIFWCCYRALKVLGCKVDPSQQFPGKQKRTLWDNAGDYAFDWWQANKVEQSAESDRL